MSVIESSSNGSGGGPEAIPWYRQFWPWFLIAPPLAAVLGGIATLYLAVSSPDRLVQRDHHGTLGPVVTDTRPERRPSP